MKTHASGRQKFGMPPAARVAVVLLALGLSCFLVYWRAGVLGGTYEANLSARSAMLAISDTARSEAKFPGLGTGGSDFAQVWREGPDGSGTDPIWRSPSLGQRDLPWINGKLFRVTLADGTSGYGSSVRLEAGRGGLRAMYVETASPYLAESVRTAGLAMVFVLLPAVIIAAGYPRRW